MDGHDLSVHLLKSDQKLHAVEIAGRWRESIASDGFSISSTSRDALRWTTTQLAGQRLALGFDDERLYSDFAAMLGATPPAASLHPDDATVIVEAFSHAPIDGFGYFRVTRDGKAIPAIDYFIGYSRPDCPYREIDRHDGWTALGDAAGDVLFLVQNEHCLFRLTDTWTITALSLLFRAAFGFEHDAILFHAAAVIIEGKGCIFAGPRYSGKSTTSLALASRGHHFLSDEIAWYVPSTRKLIDFRRPVGLREGIRASAVDARLQEMQVSGINWHDSLRLPVDTIVPQEPPRTATLDVIVFLKPFEKVPRFVRLEPSLEHLPLLQPIPISMLNVSPARRMMEMVRLVSSVQMYDLHPGHPDDTAKAMEDIARS